MIKEEMYLELGNKDNSGLHIIINGQAIDYLGIRDNLRRDLRKYGRLNE
ncbi:MAG: hypothetical protein K8E24_014450 [Methanobacterium paludis]|nr:hypothetical protein [Methanobacterium paludis]